MLIIAMVQKDLAPDLHHCQCAGRVWRAGSWECPWEGCIQWAEHSHQPSDTNSAGGERKTLYKLSARSEGEIPQSQKPLDHNWQKISPMSGGKMH